MQSSSENPVEEPDGTWTAARLALLEQLWLAGETAQAIAQQLGVSRSAVMGKLFRLRRASKQQRAQKKRCKKSGKKRDRKRGKSLLELTNESCRWPIGDPASAAFHFCGAIGADFEQDVPYCALHMQRAYVAAPPRKTNGPGATGGWHTVSPGISAAVWRMFRDAMARKERT